MKQYLLPFLFSFICSFTLAQTESFEFIDENAEQHFAVFAFKNEQEKFIITSSLDTSSIIFQLSQEGVFEDSINISIADLDLGIHFIHEEAENYLLFGSGNSLLSDSSFQWVGTLQKDLSDFNYELFYVSDSLISGEECKMIGEEVFCVGTTNDPVFSLPRFPFLFRYNLLTDNIRLERNLPIEDLVNSFEIKNDSSLFTYGYYTTEYNYLNNEVISMQNNLRGMAAQGNIKKFKPDQFLVTGKITGCGQNMKLGFGQININLEEINFHALGPPGDIRDIPAPFKSIDFVDTSNVFCGGTSNARTGSLELLEEVDSYFSLANFDASLNKNWERFYGGDAYYIMIGLLATQDGGCLMYGMKHDYRNNLGKRLLYVLKVDQNGDIITETNIPLVEDLRIFPNPFQEKLRIEFPKLYPRLSDHTLSLYDVLGHLVYSQDINQKNNELYLEGLASGTYFLIVKNDIGEIVRKEKVIKGF